MTVTAALLGVAAAESDRTFACIAAGAVVIFALLDARYLALERRYIELYEATVAAPATDWSLRARPTGASSVVGGWVRSRGGCL